MKTRMNFTRICCALSAFVMCLSSTPHTRGQTLGNEEPMGTGYEPVVNCDRIVDPTNGNKRIQLVWMDPNNPTTPGIDWAISHKLGAPRSWTTVLFPPASGQDPVATCDIWSTGTTREMYFGWLGTLQSAQSAEFQRSPSGTFVDESTVMGQGDRPWLVANTASLYLSLHLQGVGTDTGYVKRAAIPAPTCSPSPCPVDWSGSANLVFQPDTNTNLSGDFPVAAHADAANPPNETVFLMARQYVANQGPGGCIETGFNQNSVRIKRSLDKGVNWQDAQTIDVNGVDGFVNARDGRMVNQHISRDPSTSRNYVYALYVRNEQANYPPGEQNVLHCMASTDGGQTWSGEKTVFTPPGPPSNGFASVPDCAHPTGGAAGFYRIARVWSSVDDSDYVYVVWMDNRYGAYVNDTSRDYWHVFCSRSTDQGNTWSAPIQVSGTTSDPQGTASIGGYGDPYDNFAWNPPGDFLSCDVDSQYLYVAWPDSRANQTNTSALTNVYFRTVQF